MASNARSPKFVPIRVARHGGDWTAKPVSWPLLTRLLLGTLVRGLLGQVGAEHKVSIGRADLKAGRFLAQECGVHAALDRLIAGADKSAGGHSLAVLVAEG